MPDATEWLVEFEDLSKHTAYERFANVNDAIPFLHKVLGTGQRPRLYRETPITLTIDVGGEAPVKAPRRRRKKEAKEGAAGPDAQDVAPAQRGESGQGAAPGSAASNLASPVFDCEARFDGDPPCTLSVTLDPVTGGHFCLLHMVQMTESARREMHRRHGSRNRPVRVAHAG